MGAAPWRGAGPSGCVRVVLDESRLRRCRCAGFQVEISDAARSHTLVVADRICPIYSTIPSLEGFPEPRDPLF